jgi:glycosyltransferase involved in cell wall biosynthesis
MVPYKRMPLVVEAFSKMPGRRLVVLGEGPDLERCKQLATPNIELLGHQPFARLREYMQNAKAFVFAAEEDFGITLVEAQACGTPVIAFGRGGASEIVRPPGVAAEPTGVFFMEQTPESIVDAVERFEALAPPIAPAACRRNAERFSIQQFRRSFKELVDKALEERGLGAPAQEPQPGPQPEPSPTSLPLNADPELVRRADKPSLAPVLPA